MKPKRKIITTEIEIETGQEHIISEIIEYEIDELKGSKGILPSPYEPEPKELFKPQWKETFWFSILLIMLFMLIFISFIALG